MYDSNLKYKWDNKNVLDCAVQEAKKEAKLEEAIEIAREMKKDGLPIDQIVKFTKLSIEQIDKL
jgi:predicted transposase/invertase (TIGR01784 family)